MNLKYYPEPKSRAWGGRLQGTGYCGELYRTGIPDGLHGHAELVIDAAAALAFYFPSVMSRQFPEAAPLPAHPRRLISVPAAAILTRIILLAPVPHHCPGIP